MSKTYTIKKFKYTIPVDIEIPGRVVCEIAWIHPDDISKVNISDISNICEIIEGDEFIFLLYRNLMLEAGYVPRMYSYDLKKIIGEDWVYLGADGRLTDSININNKHKK